MPAAESSPINTWCITRPFNLPMPPDTSIFQAIRGESWRCFVANAIPFLILQWFTHAGWVIGIFPAFALYYVAFEEIHWRTHMGGWLPKWLRPAARHHLLHHARGTERFNVFLPIFDWVIEPIERPLPRRSKEPRV